MSDVVEKIVFDCRHCGTSMRVRPERAGRAVHCIQCHCAIRVPAPPPPSAAHLNVVSDHTMVGEPALFDTMVVPAIKDVEIVTADGVVHHSAELHIRDPHISPLKRIGIPAGTGMILAACVIVALVIILRTTSGPKQSMAAGRDLPVTTQPAETMPK